MQLSGLPTRGLSTPLIHKGKLKLENGMGLCCLAVSLPAVGLDQEETISRRNRTPSAHKKSCTAPRSTTSDSPTVSQASHLTLEHGLPDLAHLSHTNPTATSRRQACGKAKRVFRVCCVARPHVLVVDNSKPSFALPTSPFMDPHPRWLETSGTAPTSRCAIASTDSISKSKSDRTLLWFVFATRNAKRP